MVSPMEIGNVKIIGKQKEVALKSLSEEVRKRRQQLGYGVRQLARLADVDPSAITRLESGESPGTPETLGKISRALKERPGWGTEVLLDYSNGEESVVSDLARRLSIYSEEELEIIKRVMGIIDSIQHRSIIIPMPEQTHPDTALYDAAEAHLDKLTAEKEAASQNETQEVGERNKAEDLTEKEQNSGK